MNDSPADRNISRMVGNANSGIYSGKMSPFSRDKAATVAFGYKNIVR